MHRRRPGTGRHLRTRSLSALPVFATSGRGRGGVVGEPLGVTAWVILERKQVEAFAVFTGDPMDPCRRRGSSRLAVRLHHHALVLGARCCSRREPGLLCLGADNARLNHGADKVRIPHRCVWKSGPRTPRSGVARVRRQASVHVRALCGRVAAHRAPGPCASQTRSLRRYLSVRDAVDAGGKLSRCDASKVLSFRASPTDAAGRVPRSAGLAGSGCHRLR